MNCHLCLKPIETSSVSVPVYPQGEGEPPGPVRVHSACLDWNADTFVILYCPYRRELRVVRSDAIIGVTRRNPDGGFARQGGQPTIEIVWTDGSLLDFHFPPGTSSLLDLKTFQTVDAAWESVRDDYCPSLHP